MSVLQTLNQVICRGETWAGIMGNLMFIYISVFDKYQKNCTRMENEVIVGILFGCSLYLVAYRCIPKRLRWKK